MTTVSIEQHDPRTESVAKDLAEVLRGQAARQGDWAEELATWIHGKEPGPLDCFLRAIDGDGRFLGGALLLARRDPGDAQARPWLAALWIHPDFRAQGLGRRLGQLAEARARAAGATEILATIHPEDDAALFMSERWGYFRETVVVSKALEE